MANFSLRSFADFAARTSARLGVGYHAALDRGAAIVADDARSRLGHYQPGWPSLTQETIARKRQGDSPLLETGAMRDAIHHEVGWMRAEVYCDDPVAVFHEEGTSRMPPRPFMGPAALEREADVAHEVGQQVAAALRGDGVTIVGVPRR